MNMKNKNVIGERPPLPEETRRQIADITEWLNNNETSFLDFTPHNALVMLVDRAWCALFPSKRSAVKRKKYESFPF